MCKKIFLLCISKKLRHVNLHAVIHCVFMDIFSKAQFSCVALKMQKSKSEGGVMRCRKQSKVFVRKITSRYEQEFLNGQKHLVLPYHVPNGTFDLVLTLFSTLQGPWLYRGRG